MHRRIFAAAVLAATCLSATFLSGSPVSTEAAEPTPLDVFHKFYKERSPELRLKAVAQLAGEHGAGVVEALFQAACDEDRGVRERTAAILEEVRSSPDEIAAIVRAGLGKAPPEARVLAAHALAVAGSKALPELRAALSDRQADVQRTAALSLANLGDASAAPKLSELLTSKDANVRAAAIEAIGILLGDDAVGPATAVVLDDRSFEARVAACEVLGRHPGPATADTIAHALFDASWSLRVAAARALGAFHVDAPSARAAAGPLVRGMAAETRARVRSEIAGSLFGLTGIDFGPEPDRWKAWFAEAGSTFEPPARRPQRAGIDPHATSGHLLDLPIESEHVSFVLDYSHSMTDPIRFGVQATKHDELLKSLEVVFGKLVRDARMNVIPFGTAPHPFKPALFAATSGAKQSALRFLADLAPDGRTNLYDSLEIALSDPDADTIVLVTDGAPTEGRRRARGAILAGIRQLDRYRLARIHAVEIGAQNTSPRWKGFLKEIADATGGLYLQR